MRGMQSEQIGPQDYLSAISLLVMPGLAAFAKASAGRASKQPRRSLGGDGSRSSTSRFPEAPKTWMAGHRRAEATPSFGRLCPAMTRWRKRRDNHGILYT